MPTRLPVQPYGAGGFGAALCAGTAARRAVSGATGAANGGCAARSWTSAFRLAPHVPVVRARGRARDVAPAADTGAAWAPRPLDANRTGPGPGACQVVDAPSRGIPGHATPPACEDGRKTDEGDGHVPGTNLTREEAQQRARLLTVDAYEIELDLSGAQEGGTFRSVTTVRFDVRRGRRARPSSTWSRPTVHEVVLNGERAGPGRGLRGLPDRAAGPAGRAQRAAGRRRLRVHQHRRGPAPLRRPGRRAGLPVHAVRGAGRAPGLRRASSSPTSRRPSRSP